ncbi:hypothetical protein ACFVYF_00650 [Streptomyces sp. NPDC058274]|jgi:hypothetical protein|uniref:hypothetical protein n=1 Tax=Streptomyces sp. NPDC058274 TaxID=3346416 RepID=UPI0036EAFB39
MMNSPEFVYDREVVFRREAQQMERARDQESATDFARCSSELSYIDPAIDDGI